jgi:hypothetical protein
MTSYIWLLKCNQHFHHSSGLYCSEIVSCLGLSNGSSVAVWIRNTAARLLSLKRQTILPRRNEKGIVTKHLITSLPLKNLIFLFEKVDYRSNN